MSRRKEPTIPNEFLDQLLAELRAASARFGELAAIHSACISRAADGRPGQIGPGDTLPEFEAALRGLPEDGITPEPVETRYGFHLPRLDARAGGAVLPFEAVAPRLRTAAEKAAWIRAARDFTRGLLAGARIGGLDPAVGERHAPWWDSVCEA